MTRDPDVKRVLPPRSTGPIRVLIADDHALVREGLRKVFELDDAIELTGDAATACETLFELRRGKVDVVVLDLLMPGCTDVDLIERIVEAYPRLAVLVLTMYADPHIARRALAAGASGYLTKDISIDLLIEAVHSVAAGRSLVDPALSAALASEDLPARERRVAAA
jgi:DNA-binding NarL/FixJ family response regulator